MGQEDIVLAADGIGGDLVADAVKQRILDATHPAGQVLNGAGRRTE
jgi:hypothetical protein